MLLKFYTKLFKTFMEVLCTLSLIGVTLVGIILGYNFLGNFVGALFGGIAGLIVAIICDCITIVPWYILFEMHSELQGVRSDIRDLNYAFVSLLSKDDEDDSDTETLIEENSSEEKTSE